MYKFNESFLNDFSHDICSIEAKSLSLDITGRRILLSGKKGQLLLDINSVPPKKALRSNNNRLNYGVIYNEWCPLPSHFDYEANIMNGTLLVSQWSNYEPSIISTIDSGHRLINDISWSYFDPNFILTTSSNRLTSLWDLRQTKKTVLNASSTMNAIQVQYCQLSSNFFVTVHDNYFKVWDLRNIKSHYSLFNAHNNIINDINWSPFSTQSLVSASTDQKVKTWNVSENSSPMFEADLCQTAYRSRYLFNSDLLLIATQNDGVNQNFSALLLMKIFNDDLHKECEIVDRLITKEDIMDVCIKSAGENDIQIVLLRKSGLLSFIKLEISNHNSNLLNDIHNRKSYTINNEVKMANNLLRSNNQNEHISYDSNNNKNNIIIINNNNNYLSINDNSNGQESNLYGTSVETENNLIYHTDSYATIHDFRRRQTENTISISNLFQESTLSSLKPNDSKIISSKSFSISCKEKNKSLSNSSHCSSSKINFKNRDIVIAESPNSVNSNGTNSPNEYTNLMKTMYVVVDEIRSIMNNSLMNGFVIHKIYMSSDSVHLIIYNLNTSHKSSKILVNIPIGYPCRIIPHFLIESDSNTSYDFKTTIDIQIKNLENMAKKFVSCNRPCLESCLLDLLENAPFNDSKFYLSSLNFAYNIKKCHASFTIQNQLIFYYNNVGSISSTQIGNKKYQMKNLIEEMKKDNNKQNRCKLKWKKKNLSSNTLNITLVIMIDMRCYFEIHHFNNDEIEKKSIQSIVINQNQSLINQTHLKESNVHFKADSTDFNVYSSVLQQRTIMSHMASYLNILCYFEKDYFNRSSYWLSSFRDSILFNPSFLELSQLLFLHYISIGDMISSIICLKIYNYIKFMRSFTIASSNYTKILPEYYSFNYIRTLQNNFNQIYNNDTLMQRIIDSYTYDHSNHKYFYNERTKLKKQIHFHYSNDPVEKIFNSSTFSNVVNWKLNTVDSKISSYISCFICQRTIKGLIFICNQCYNYFHFSHAIKWLRDHNRCPACSYEYMNFN